MDEQASGGVLDLLGGLGRYGLDRWIDQDTERSTYINNADPYRQTAGGQTVTAPGSDTRTVTGSVAAAVANPVVLIAGVLLLVGVGWLVARKR
jgi:hypothetical protein